MIPKNEVTRESPPEMSRFRDLAESLGLKFDDLIQSGSQANVIGIRSETLLFSQRLDSRTYSCRTRVMDPGRNGESGRRPTRTI
jgi:hypothetical protein